MSVDITIQETIEEVDITINQNVIEVNVTRTSGGGGVQSVTGNVVDNTDPLNPVINITIPDVPTLQEVCDEGNSLLDTSIVSQDTATGNEAVFTGSSISFGNLSNPLTTYISNRTLQIVDSGNTATVLLPTPTDVGGTVIFPSVGSDIKTVAYAEDFPKSLEIKYIADQDVIQKADTAYYLVNNDVGIAESEIILDLDEGFEESDTIVLTKIVETADGASSTKITVAGNSLGGQAAEFYYGVDKTTLSSVGQTIDTIYAGDVITFKALSSYQFLVNVERNTKSLELEFTQSGTADPIVTSLIGNRGAGVTGAYAGSSQLIFTFDLQILENVKDSFKGDTNRNVFMTMAISGLNQNFYSFYAASDHILIVEMFELVDGYITPADIGAVSPIRLKLDYKF